MQGEDLAAPLRTYGDAIGEAMGSTILDSEDDVLSTAQTAVATVIACLTIRAFRVVLSLAL